MVESVTPAIAFKRMADGAALIDVREPYEHEDEWVAAAVNVPMASIPGALDGLRAERRPLIICHTGVRSLAVCEWLESQGVDAVNVEGGMVAWAESGLPVDHGLPIE